MTNMFTKRSSTSLIIRAMQIKITRRHHLTVRMAINEKLNNNCWLECGEKRTLCTICENKWCS